MVVPGHVLLALLPNLDVDEDKRVQTHLPVLLDAVVEGARPPGIGEEHERDRLAKVVELEAGRAAGVEDGSVVDDLRRDLERACAKEKVGVGRGTGEVRVVVGVSYRQRATRSSRGSRTHPKGSPTTRKQTSTVWASLRISSLSVSTISRVARMTSLP